MQDNQDNMDMFSQYEQRQPQAQAPQPPQQPPRPIPQTALALKEPSRTRQIALTAAMLALLGGIGVLGWYAMEESKAPKNIADLPVIEANPAPYKEQPVNPGGMDIPDKERMVFSTISSSAGEHQDVIDTGMAALTPEPEEPATPEQVAEASSAEELAETAEPVAEATPAAGEAETSPEEEPVEVASVPEAVTIPPAPSPEVAKAAAEADKGGKPRMPEPEAAAEAPEAKPEAEAPAPETTKAPEPVKAPKVIHVKEDEKPAKATKAVARSTPASKAYRVQLGSFKSEKSLELGWISLKKKFPGELGKLHRAIEVADLGEKGTFYRLHAGTLESAAAAQAVCDKLKAQSQGCIVAK